MNAVFWLSLKDVHWMDAIHIHIAKEQLYIAHAASFFLFIVSYSLV